MGAPLHARAGAFAPQLEQALAHGVHATRCRADERNCGVEACPAHLTVHAVCVRPNEVGRSWPIGVQGTSTIGAVGRRGRGRGRRWACVARADRRRRRRGRRCVKQAISRWKSGRWCQRVCDYPGVPQRTGPIADLTAAPERPSIALSLSFPSDNLCTQAAPL